MMALTGLGEVGRRGADALGSRNVRNLLSLVSNPGSTQQGLIPPMQRGGVALATTGGLAAAPQLERPAGLEPWLQNWMGVPRLPDPIPR
jgi:hypothetical protein